MQDPLMMKLSQMEDLLQSEQAALVAHDSQKVAELAAQKAQLVGEMDGLVNSWRNNLKHPELPAEVQMAELIEKVEAQNRLNGSLIENHLLTLYARINGLNMAANPAGAGDNSLYDAMGSHHVTTTGSRAYAQA